MHIHSKEKPDKDYRRLGCCHTDAKFMGLCVHSFMLRYMLTHVCLASRFRAASSRHYRRAAAFGILVA